MNGTKLAKYGIIGILVLIIGQMLYNIVAFVIYGTIALLFFGFVVLWFNWMWSMGILT